MTELEKFLVELGKKYFDENKSEIKPLLPENEEANALITDLNHYPHAFVLGCLMDTGINSERALVIPFRIKEIFGNFEIDFLAKKTEDEYKDIFKNNSLHRFNTNKAKVFYKALQRIVNEMDGDASKIWSNNPPSELVVFYFRGFYGCGQKVSTMAANLLARNFHIPFFSYKGIDVSTDVHVIRVMKRLGLISSEDKDAAVEKARSINPDFPGIIDFPLWKTGKEICHKTNPDCEKCPFKDFCPRNI